MSESYVSNVDEGALLSPHLLELLEAALGEEVGFKLTAKGWSMLPSIRDGDILTVRSVSAPDIDVGTLVVFRSPETKMLIAHRIVGRVHDRYLMKGDNAFKADGAIPRQNILGVVTEVERKIKKVVWGLGFERHLLTFLNKTRILFLFFKVERSHVIGLSRPRAW